MDFFFTRCLLEDNIVDSTVKDSEFKDLKEELGKLNSLFSQMSVSKVEVNDKCQVSPLILLVVLILRNRMQSGGA